MNNIELKRFLDRTACGSRFGKKKIQILACDQLPTEKSLSKGSTVIANLSPSNTEGTHWVLFHVPILPLVKHCKAAKNLRVGTSLIFFDSLGITNRNFYPQFRLFFRNYNPILCNNGVAVQETKRYSESCGMYCMYVAMHLCQGKGFNDILMKFSEKNMNLNECLVLQYLNESFDTDYFSRFKGCIIK